MDSFVSQLQTVAEIWRDKDVAFSRIFGHYRKIGNIRVSSNLPFLSTFPVSGLETPFFGYKLAPGYLEIPWERIFEIFILFGFFGPISGSKNRIF